MRSLRCVLAVLVLTVATVACSGPAPIALDPAASLMTSADRPADLAPADSLTANCTGVQYDRGQWEIQCLDLNRYFGVRFDKTFSAKSCRAILEATTSNQISSYDPDLFSEVRPSHTFRMKASSASNEAAQVSNNMSINNADAENQDAFALCVPHREGGLVALMAYPGISLDMDTAVDLMTSIVFDGLSESRLSVSRPETTPLLGRTLDVHSSCKFMGAENLSCFPNGQMDWSRFSSMEIAQQANAMKVEAAKRAAASVLSDTTVTCTFEEVETECRRILYKATRTRIATLGASNRLIALYAVANVRGIPSQATCSFFDDQARSNGLAPLCDVSFDVPSAADLMTSTDE